MTHIIWVILFESYYGLWIITYNLNMTQIVNSGFWLVIFRTKFVHTILHHQNWNRLLRDKCEVLWFLFKIIFVSNFKISVSHQRCDSTECRIFEERSCFWKFFVEKSTSIIFLFNINRIFNGSKPRISTPFNAFISRNISFWIKISNLY